MKPTEAHFAVWNMKVCAGQECITGMLDNGGGEAMILEADMPRHFVRTTTGELTSNVTLFNFCPVCGRSLKPNNAVRVK